jgi:hypothetical protein
MPHIVSAFTDSFGVYNRASSSCTRYSRRRAASAAVAAAAFTALLAATAGGAGPDSSGAKLPAPAVRAPAAFVPSARISRSSATSVPWRGDYETGNFSQWDDDLQQKVSDRAAIVSSPLRQGRYAARFEVDPGDNDVAGSGSGERTEAWIDQASTDGFEGREEWYAWSTMFAPDFSANVSDWNAFTQFHNTGTAGCTTSFRVSGTRLVFGVCGGRAGRETGRWVIDKKKQNGVWYDFVVHVRWSSDPATGYVQVWENARSVVPFTRLATLYPGQGVYLKQGYYRNAQGNVAVVYHDGTRRASGYRGAIAGFPAGTWPRLAPLYRSASPHQRRKHGRRVTASVGRSLFAVPTPSGR